MTSPVPLARLFAMAYRDLIDGLHERLRQRVARRPTRLRVRPARGPRRPHQRHRLAGLMGVSKQAASKLVDAMAASGYVTRSDGADDGRQRPVSLTARATTCSRPSRRSTPISRRAGPAIAGRAEIEQVRSVLVGVLAARHGGAPARPPDLVKGGARATPGVI